MKYAMKGNVQSLGEGDLWGRKRLCPVLRHYADITTEGV
jgi:hypothetical protein